MPFLYAQRNTEQSKLCSLLDTLSSSSKALAVEIPAFMSECRRLLASAHNVSNLSSSTSSDASTGTADQPWGQSREAYLAWRIEHSRQDDAAHPEKESNDDMISTTRSLASKGKAQDAAVSQVALVVEAVAKPCYYRL